MPNDMQKNGNTVSVSFADLFAVLKKNIVWILIATVIAGILGYLYTKTLDPTFSTKSMYVVYAEAAGGDDPTENTGSYDLDAMTANQISMSKAYKFLYVTDMQSNDTMARVARLWLLAKYGYSDKTAPSSSSIRHSYSLTTSEDDHFLFNVSIATGDKALTQNLNLALMEIMTNSYKSDPEYQVLKAAVYGIAPCDNPADPARLAVFKASLLPYGIVFTDTLTKTADEQYTAFSASLSDLLSRADFSIEKLPSARNDIAYTAAFIKGSHIYFRDASVTPSTNMPSGIAILIAIAAGFILSYAFFFILKITDTKIRTEEDLGNACGYPILSSVPTIQLDSEDDR